MPAALEVLLIDNTERDLAAVPGLLAEAAVAFRPGHVDSPAALRAALESQSWDIAICAYHATGFSGFPALALLQSQTPRLPVLVVSGVPGEEAAVAAMKAGAADYLTRAGLDRLVPTMREAMREADGIGLSANQIGLDVAVFVARVENKFYALFNPKIVKISEEADELHEGCLSVPHKVGVVPRPSRLTLEGKDQRGKPIKIKAWGLLARVFQHETDHLNGILFANKAKRMEALSDIGNQSDNQN